jgi:hypothetical protein
VLVHGVPEKTTYKASIGERPIGEDSEAGPNGRADLRRGIFTIAACGDSKLANAGAIHCGRPKLRNKSCSTRAEMKATSI